MVSASPGFGLTRAVKKNYRTRARKYKLGATAGKHKLGARARAWGRGSGPGAKQRVGGQEIQIPQKLAFIHKVFTFYIKKVFSASISETSETICFYL